MLKQAKRLVRAMKENHEYDYFGAWKVLTLSVGSNDLCSCCRWGKNFRIKYKPENYLKSMCVFSTAYFIVTVDTN